MVIHLQRFIGNFTETEDSREQTQGYIYRNQWARSIWDMAAQELEDLERARTLLTDKRQAFRSSAGAD